MDIQQIDIEIITEMYTKYQYSTRINHLTALRYKNVLFWKNDLQIDSFKLITTTSKAE